MREQVVELRAEVARLHADQEKDAEVAAEHALSTAKGRPYEEAVFEAVDAIAAGHGDLAESVGDAAGFGGRKGDVVVGLDGCAGPPAAASSSRPSTPRSAATPRSSTSTRRWPSATPPSASGSSPPRPAPRPHARPARGQRRQAVRRLRPRRRLTAAARGRLRARPRPRRPLPPRRRRPRRPRPARRGRARARRPRGRAPRQGPAHLRDHLDRRRPQDPRLHGRRRPRPPARDRPHGRRRRRRRLTRPAAAALAHAQRAAHGLALAAAVDADPQLRAPRTRGGGRPQQLRSASAPGRPAPPGALERRVARCRRAHLAPGGAQDQHARRPPVTAQDRPCQPARRPHLDVREHRGPPDGSRAEDALRVVAHPGREGGGVVDRRGQRGRDRGRRPPALDGARVARVGTDGDGTSDADGWATRRHGAGSTAQARPSASAAAAAPPRGTARRAASTVGSGGGTVAARVTSAARRLHRGSAQVGRGRRSDGHV